MGSIRRLGYDEGMVEQLSMLVLVVALATGLITSVVATTYMKSGQPEFFRYFLTNILLFNLLILSGLVFRYLTIQLQNPELQAYSFILPSVLVVMAALKLSWLYAYILMNKSLPVMITPKRTAMMLARAGLGIFFIYLLVSTAAWFMHMGVLQQAGIIVFEAIIIGGALLATLQLLVTALQLPINSRRRSIMIFSAYHILLMSIILSVLVLGWLQPGPQKLGQLLANGGFLVLFNLFPLIWLRWFPPLQSSSELELFESLGITRRERDIIKLIQCGMTNQEIADELYISVVTVKDHNHNIFKKSGVRNRLELSNLFHQH